MQFSTAAEKTTSDKPLSFYNLRDYIEYKHTEDIQKEYENRAYYEFLKETIPAKFVDPFYQFTKDKKYLGIEILGIAQHESGWRVFKGKINKNGSVDLGPLMLNSYNIQDEKFMKAYASNCVQYRYDVDIYFMCICINFYSSIRSELGPFVALQVYNGGYRVTRPNCNTELKQTVTTYANVVYRHINKAYDNWKKFKTNYFENLKQEANLIDHYMQELTTNKLNIVEIERSSPFSGFVNHNRKPVIFKFDEEYYKFYILMDWDFIKVYYPYPNIPIPNVV